MLHVLVACKEARSPGGLYHLGTDWLIHYDTSPGWGVASNRLLDLAAANGGDALFLDDDITLTETSLEGVREYYDHAELFGLDLHDMNGVRQHGARHVMGVDGTIHNWVEPGPAYVAHCTTSAIYLKAAAIQVLRFPIWDGVHWEDVAFCLDAWLHGFRVLAVPGHTLHAIENGVGATKRHIPDFWPRWAANAQAMTDWINEHSVLSALAEGVIPIGAKPL